MTDETKTAIANSAFCYSVSLLKMLRKMELITDAEYEKIKALNAKHYGVELYCV